MGTQSSAAPYGSKDSYDAHRAALGYWRPCETCGTSIRVLPCDERKAAKKGGQPKRFCSMACRNAAYRGDGNPKWRGGQLPQASGYVYTYAPLHPYATEAGYVRQHRLVMEAHLGRYLTPDEVVHHKNHVRDDNRIENLELMASQSEHRIHHGEWTTVPCSNCGSEVRRTAHQLRKWKHAYCSRRCAAAAGSRANSNAASARKQNRS